MSIRVGVYLCHCGTNIGGVVNIAKVAAYARTLEEVALVQENSFMCSGVGQELIAKDIRENRLNRIVVAACSPHLHEATFRKAAARAGLNPFLFTMCNIREHNAWTTTDSTAATIKTNMLVAAAVGRVRLQEELVPISVPVHPATLIVGGGIAGIHAALVLADAGHPVYLVEKGPSIGGHMAQLDKTFPALECSACILTPKMFGVAQHANITLLTLSEVAAVQGVVGNFTVQVRVSPRYLSEECCTGCGICEENCPKKVIDLGHNAGLGMRKAVYKPFAQAVPNYPVLNRADCLYFTTGKCRICEKSCPTSAIDFEEQEQQLTITVGNIILATGYSLFDATQVSQYGYGRFANVFSALEMERMLSSTGPTGGRVVLRDGVTEPKKVAIIHCVGSRDKNYNEYCSKVCCMYSLKFGLLIMEQTGAEVYNFYIDIRTPGKGYEEFYHRLQKKGAHFVRGRVAMVMDAAFTAQEESHLIVQVEDTLISRKRRIPVDMVILSPAMEPRADATEMAQKLGLACDDKGFFTESHAKLAPVATMTDGVFIAGACQGPKDITETVAQAGAAAAEVMAAINRGVVEIEPLKAEIDESLCCGCRICNELCPYQAIIYEADTKISRINPVLCRGCGTCVAACPSQVIKGSHFSTEQIMAEIKGLLGAATGGTRQ